jgi:hypothetical protein
VEEGGRVKVLLLVVREALEEEVTGSSQAGLLVVLVQVGKVIAVVLVEAQTEALVVVLVPVVEVLVEPVVQEPLVQSQVRP